MPGGNRPALGNEAIDQLLYLPAATFPTVAANGQATNTITVKGLLPGDYISGVLQAPPAHLVLDNMYVSAADTITALWSSDSTGISTSTVNILLEVCRAENSSLGITQLPSQLV